MKNLYLIPLLALSLASSANATVTNNTTQKKVVIKTSVPAQDTVSSEIDSLGDDQAVVQRARALSPNNTVEIVQKRAVDRHNRLELGVDYGMVGGGDSYVNSQTFGGHIDYHITPHWSVGVRYLSYVNTLTNEGQNVFNNAAQLHAAGNDGLQKVSPVDSPIQTGLIVADWYPVYGKMNIANWILHFDIYTLVGYGRTETLNNGFSPTYTGGAGIGFWLTNSLALRLEGRYQGYQDKPLTDVRQENTFIGQASLGILL